MPSRKRPPRMRFPDPGSRKPAGTAGDLLADVMGSSDPERNAQAEDQSGAKVLPHAPPPPPPDYVVATYRLLPEHVDALQTEALSRKRARGSRGRADASEVLRDILTGWVRSQR